VGYLGDDLDDYWPNQLIDVAIKQIERHDFENDKELLSSVNKLNKYIKKYIDKNEI
jgi:hypothetical protein